MFLPHITEPVSENPDVNTDLMIQEWNPQMLYYYIHSFSPSAVKYLAKAGYGQGFVKDREIQGD